MGSEMCIRDRMDAGRFERLEKSTRQAQRHDVLVPGFQAPAGAELDHPRRDQRPALHCSEQLVSGLLIGHIAAAIDESVADAMLQWNAPAPACLVRDRAGVGHCRSDRFCLHCYGAVARQPMRPILILGVQRLFDQHTAKAGAVDEEIAFDDLARIEHERLDEAGIAILADVLDLPLDTLRTMALGELAQELRVNRGIQVIREVDIRLGGRREFLPACGLQLQALIAQFRLHAPSKAMQPEMVKLANPGRLPVHTEGMDVAVAGALPVLERDAELEGRRGGAHELLLVDVEQSMERANRRNRRFAHAPTVPISSDSTSVTSTIPRNC